MKCFTASGSWTGVITSPGSGLLVFVVLDTRVFINTTLNVSLVQIQTWLMGLCALGHSETKSGLCPRSESEQLSSWCYIPTRLCQRLFQKLWAKQTPSGLCRRVMTHSTELRSGHRNNTDHSRHWTKQRAEHKVIKTRWACTHSLTAHGSLYHHFMFDQTYLVDAELALFLCSVVSNY